MPSNTALSKQHVLNRINGQAYDTKLSEQQIYNTANTTNNLSLQEIMNTNMASASKTAKSTQELLYNKLKVTLGLTQPWTYYTEQELMNRALAASVTLTTLIGK